MIEGGIDFYRVEIPRVKPQFVDFTKWVKNAGPGSGTGTRRIAPAAGSDPPDAGVIAFLRLWQERWLQGQEVSPYPK